MVFINTFHMAPKILSQYKVTCTRIITLHRNEYSAPKKRNSKHNTITQHKIQKQVISKHITLITEHNMPTPQRILHISKDQANIELTKDITKQSPAGIIILAQRRKSTIKHAHEDTSTFNK